VKGYFRNAVERRQPSKVDPVLNVEEKRSGGTTPNRATCWYCKKPGHLMKDCRKRKSRRGGGPNRNGQGGNRRNGGAGSPGWVLATMESVPGYDNTDYDGLHFLFPEDDEDPNGRLYILDSVPVLSLQNDLQDVWTLDSGASTHATFHREWLHDLTPVDQPMLVSNPNGTQMPVEGIGCVQLKDTLIQGVRYVPQMKVNLISIPVLCGKGCTVTFDERYCFVKKGGVSKKFAERKGSLYVTFNDEATLHVNSGSATPLFNHQKLGHPSAFATFKTMNDSSMKEYETAIRGCHVCVESKLRRSPFPAVPTEKRATRIGYLISSDLEGPFPEPSYSGALYNVKYIDDFSRYLSVYFLRRKSEQPQKFSAFVAKFERLFNCRISSLLTDGGGEYKSKEFQDYLSSQGIRHLVTAANSPQTNGLAERHNLTLMDKVRTMFSGASQTLSKRLWAECMFYAAHLYNVTFRKDLGMSPFEKAFGYAPSLNKLLPWGCSVYYVGSQKPPKPNPRSSRGWFIGVNEGFLAYKVLSKSSGKVILSRDVVMAPEFDVKSESVAAPDSEDDQIVLDAPPQHHLGPHQDDQDDEVDDLNLHDVEDIQEEDAKQPEIKDQQEPRRSNRVSRPPSRLIDEFPYNAYANSISTDPIEPRSYEDALAGYDYNKWRMSMDEELEALIRNNTFKIVPIERDRQVISSLWVYKLKRNHLNEIIRYKSRLTARGDMQDRLEQAQVFAPVARLRSLRLFLKISRQFKWDISQGDVPNAYLRSTEPLQETIQMYLPKGFCSFLQNHLDDDLISLLQPDAKDEDGENFKDIVKALAGGDPRRKQYVLKLNNFLYGLSQSGRAWHKSLIKFLIQSGFIQSSYDDCYLVNKDRTCMILVYVDDLLFSGTKNAMKMILKKLKAQFELKTSSVEHFLGIHLTLGDVISIDQTGYIDRVLTHFHMDQAVGVSTPLQKLDYDSPDVPCSAPYLEAIGSINYLASGSRPDIAFAISKLARYSSKPTVTHWNGVKHLLRYLKKSRDLSMTFQPDEVLRFTAFSDSDFAGDASSRKSTSGYEIFLGSDPIDWSSRLQEIIAQSTSEAEFVAANSASRELMLLDTMTRELFPNLLLGKPMLYCDNMSSLRMIDTPTRRSKYIDVKYKNVCKLQQDGKIQFAYIESRLNVADVLTKLSNHHQDLLGKIFKYAGLEGSNERSLVSLH
jgi:hypothetical protein